MNRFSKIFPLHDACLGFVVLSVLFFYLNVFTSTEASAQNQDSVVDDSEEYLDESNSEWAESRGGDLETSQGERRAGATSAFLMSFGEGSAWNSVGLRGVYWLGQDGAVSSTVGTGRFHQVGESGVQSQTTNVQSLGGRGQWWPSRHFPLALAGDFGIHHWTVKTTCLVTESIATCRGGSWSAFGGSAAGGLMLSWLAEEDVFIEWTILALKLSRPFSVKSDLLTDSTAERESIGIVKSQKLQSFANFALGMRF